VHLDDYGGGAIEAHLELKVSACMVDGVGHQLMGEEQDRLGVRLGDALLVQLGDEQSSGAGGAWAHPVRNHYLVRRDVRDLQHSPGKPLQL